MKTSELVSLVVFSDGGCLGNGSTDTKCYGSYLVKAVCKDGCATTVKVMRNTYPDLRTNNEAEYHALADALNYIDDLFTKISPVPVTFKMDSNLVYTQVSGTAKCKAPNLTAWFSLASFLVKKLNATLDTITGVEMKRVLGH